MKFYFNQEAWKKIGFDSFPAFSKYCHETFGFGYSRAIRLYTGVGNISDFIFVCNHLGIDPREFFSITQEEVEK